MVSRKTCGLYINEEIFKAFTLYASKQKPLSSCEVWETALLEYMKDHPVNEIKVNIQQVASTIPSRRDNIRIKIVSRKLKNLISALDTMNGKDTSLLEDKLLTWIAKGADIKNPSNEFLELLERAMNEI